MFYFPTQRAPGDHQVPIAQRRLSINIITTIRQRRLSINIITTIRQRRLSINILDLRVRLENTSTTIWFRPSPGPHLGLSELQVADDYSTHCYRLTTAIAEEAHSNKIVQGINRII
ncbi:hypothetical protein L1987_21621 [Smallanthus sonchifolius]|uniref:Uncharacterized protein n=1 Tax=Smallanthus sonchifolius TaxID=185202 RepID=A0ACB9IE32_9ASTR|nr:hypothetical protein L1987_21621 [Smallanthus sonchifolius]